MIGTMIVIGLVCGASVDIGIRATEAVIDNGHKIVSAIKGGINAAKEEIKKEDQ